MHWNKIGIYEPVGTIILVKCKNGKVVKAKRTKPVSKDSGLEYFLVYNDGKMGVKLVGDDTPVEWAYL